MLSTVSGAGKNTDGSKRIIASIANICITWRSGQNGRYCLKVVISLLVSAILSQSGAFAETGLMSWYSTEACRFNPDPKCPTASGDSLYELERKKVLFAASNKEKLGSKIRVCYQTKCVDAIVLDRGGFEKYSRRIDASKELFRRLAPLGKGVIKVSIEKLN